MDNTGKAISLLMGGMAVALLASSLNMAIVNKAGNSNSAEATVVVDNKFVTMLKKMPALQNMMKVESK